MYETNVDSRLEPGKEKKEAINKRVSQDAKISVPRPVVLLTESGLKCETIEQEASTPVVRMVYS